MNLLAAKTYDPAVAVSKVTTAALAMTALDTTNLRLAFTIPGHGFVRVRMVTVLHGATTFPSILLGVMNGANVVGRVAPMQILGNTAVATALVVVLADFVISGLTPGAVNWDAAYGVETLVASTGLKYGGPNNAVANDAFGGFVFEIWDPKPDPVNYGLLSIDANGRVDLIKVAGTSQTARDLGANLDVAVSSRSTYAGGAVASVTAGVTVTTNNDKLGYGLSSAAVQAIWDALTSTLTTVGSVGKLLVDNINAAISSRLAAASYTAPLDASGTRAALGLASANLDTQISSRLPTASYVAPLDAAGTRAAVGIATANLDAQLAWLKGTMPQPVTRNSALNNFPFKMLDASNHVSPIDGRTVTAERAIDGGAFAPCANAVSEIGSGFYKINLAASDLNGTTITLKFTAPGADQRDFTIITAPT